MSWLLIIQVATIWTCSEGFRFCPPARPPVVSQQVVQTEEVCEARARAYRQHFGKRREVVRGQQSTMEHVTTVQCLPHAKN